MAEETHFQKRVHLLQGLYSKDVSEIIKGLSFYLSHTNPAYYYNESYLTDYVERFTSFLELLQRKRNFTKKLLSEIKKTQQFGCKMKVVVDSIWEFDLSAEEISILRKGTLTNLRPNSSLVEVTFECSMQLIQNTYKFDAFETKADIDEIVEQILAPLEGRQTKFSDHEDKAV